LHSSQRFKMPDDAIQLLRIVTGQRRDNDAGVAFAGELYDITLPTQPMQGGRFLEYRVTADDPKTLAKPYTYTRYFQRTTAELKEDFCEDR